MRCHWIAPLNLGVGFGLGSLSVAVLLMGRVTDLTAEKPRRRRGALKSTRSTRWVIILGRSHHFPGDQSFCRFKTNSRSNKQGWSPHCETMNLRQGPFLDKEQICPQIKSECFCREADFIMPTTIATKWKIIWQRWATQQLVKAKETAVMSMHTNLQPRILVMQKLSGIKHRNYRELSGSWSSWASSSSCWSERGAQSYHSAAAACLASCLDL